MAIVFEVCTKEDQRSIVRLLWVKELNAKDIHNEMFSVYGGKCLSRKAFHNWVKKRGERFADDEVVEMEMRKWLRPQSEDFYAADFEAVVKRFDNFINVGRGYVEK
jgi:hypothetical protein